MFRPRIQSGKTAGKKRKTKKRERKKNIFFIYIYMYSVGFYDVYILEKPTEMIERIHILAGVPK